MNMFDQAITSRLLRPIDVQAARLLQRIDRGQCEELPILAALASWAAGQGHTCLPLSAVSWPAVGSGFGRHLYP